MNLTLVIALVSTLAVSCMTVKSSGDDAPETYISISEPVAVAVLEFNNKTKYGERRLADSALEILTTALSRTGNYILIERDKIDEVMSEIEFQYSGNMSDDGLIELGNLLNIRYFLIGSITSFGVKVEGRDFIIAQSKFQIAKTEVDVRLVDVQTGQILYSAFGRGEIEKKIRSGATGLGASGGYDETIAGDTLRLAIIDSVHELNGYLANK